MSTIDRQSAAWAHSIGVDHRERFPHAGPQERAKLCPFRDGCDHARWYRQGLEGAPFLWSMS